MELILDFKWFPWSPCWLSGQLFHETNGARNGFEKHLIAIGEITDLFTLMGMTRFASETLVTVAFAFLVVVGILCVIKGNTGSGLPTFRNVCANQLLLKLRELIK